MVTLTTSAVEYLTSVTLGILRKTVKQCLHVGQMESGATLLAVIK